MCGIAGFCLSADEKVDAPQLSRSLLREIMSRGKDATGAAWVEYDKTAGKTKVVVSKAPVAATRFDPFLKTMPMWTRRAILHTRWATKGDPQNNLNNHPIVSGSVIGVHNGVLSNDDALFAHLPVMRHGEVDSEAAFALLDYTKHHPANVLESLRGRAALAWFDANDKRDLHLARVSGSPLVVGQTYGNSLVFASTMPLLVKAIANTRLELQWVEEIGESTYLRVRDGKIEDCYSIDRSVKEIA